MGDGWQGSGRVPGIARSFGLAMLAVAAAGCAQDQKRPGFFGGSREKPLVPRVSATRPEPGLAVRSPFVDVKVADRPGGDVEVKDELAKLPAGDSSRVGIFRSSSTSSPSDRSLVMPSPLH